MPHPDYETLHDWALPFHSTEAESCDAVTAELQEQLHMWTDFPTPKSTSFVHVRIATARPQDHTALLLGWEGDDAPTVVDAAIGQFGGGTLVFVGPTEGWVAAVKAANSGAEIKQISRLEVSKSRYADSNNAKAVTDAQRNRQHRASKSIHLDTTLAPHNEKKRRCVIL